MGKLFIVGCWSRDARFKLRQAIEYEFGPRVFNLNFDTASVDQLRQGLREANVILFVNMRQYMLKGYSVVPIRDAKPYDENVFGLVRFTSHTVLWECPLTALSFNVVRSKTMKANSIYSPLQSY